MWIFSFAHYVCSLFFMPGGHYYVPLFESTSSSSLLEPYASCTRNQPFSIGPHPKCATSLNMGISIQSLIIFVLILLGLNFFFSEFDYGVHISIVGSIVLTIVISLLMGTMRGKR